MRLTVSVMDIHPKKSLDAFVIRKYLVCILFLASALLIHAQQFSVFYRYEKGPRIDFTASHPEGENTEDSLTGAAILHVLIPSNSTTAQISLSYGKDAKGREDQSYSGMVVHRSEDMISIITLFDGSDKVENLVLYPNKGVGFYIKHSAYLGMPLMKQLAISEKDPKIPYASASIVRLRQFRQ